MPGNRQLLVAPVEPGQDDVESEGGVGKHAAAMPEWTGAVALRTSMCSSTMRARVGEHGKPTFDVLGIAHDDGRRNIRRSLCSTKNPCRLLEPTSSSPSTSILTLTGRLPFVFR